jgi:hypothetical protein
MIEQYVLNGYYTPSVVTISVNTTVCEDSGMFLNSARESREHYVILRITPITSSLMRPRRNYTLHHCVV